MKNVSIHVITLNTAKERQQRFKERFQKAGVDIQKINWYYATKNKDPQKGCFESHNQILKIAKENKEKYALVFEDDATFLKNKNWKSVEETINKFLQHAPKNWKYFSLGYLPIRTRITAHSYFVEILCAHDAHAYLINVKNAKLLDYNGTMFDSQVFCQGIKHDELHNYRYKIDTNVYGSVPMLFGQELLDSDINQLHLNQGRFLDFYQGSDNMLNISKHANSLQLAILSIILIIFLIIFIVLIFLMIYLPKKFNKNSFIIWGLMLFLILIIFGFIFGTNIHPILNFDN